MADNISLINRIIAKTKALAIYCWEGVWRDPSSSMKVKILKTVNLSVRTFLDSDLQSRAAALTYSTLLAIVPAFALIFAIGRGFNLQDLLEAELYKAFPAQSQAVHAATGFVNSYLKQASQGVLVGVGIVFLLWTLISLLSQIESNFNRLWGVKQGRSLYRKVTDYTAICLLVPVMMVCSAGINIFMSSALNSIFGNSIFSPFVSVVLDCAPFVLTCVAFMLSFLLIPNTRVRFKYAAISALICGVAFQIIQILFINGQIYVAKYNAIYGTFAFLPLLLIWLQLSWLILLFGCTLTFSMQNIFHYTFTEDVNNVSPLYMRKLTVVTAAVIARRFRNHTRPVTLSELSASYDLPIRLVTDIVDRLREAGVVYFVLLGDGCEQGITPAVNLDRYTLGELIKSVDIFGCKDFVPRFGERYSKALAVVDSLAEAEYDAASRVLLIDIPVSGCEDEDCKSSETVENKKGGNV